MKFVKVHLILSFWMPLKANSLNCVKNDFTGLNILPLVQLMEFKQPTLLNPSKRGLISQIKHFAKAGKIVKSWQRFEDHKQDTELIISSINTFPEHGINFRKALILTQDYNTTMALFKSIRINQQVFFYDTSSCELYELYFIAGKKISRILGILAENKFVWNSNVDPRYKNLII